MTSSDKHEATIQNISLEVFLSAENWLLIYTAVWCISAYWHWCNWTAHVDVRRYLPKAVHEINNRWPRLSTVAPRLFYLPLNTPLIIRLCFHEVFILSWMLEMHNKLSSEDSELACGGSNDTLFICLRLRVWSSVLGGGTELLWYASEDKSDRMVQVWDSYQRLY